MFITRLNEHCRSSPALELPLSPCVEGCVFYAVLLVPLPPLISPATDENPG